MVTKMPASGWMRAHDLVPEVDAGFVGLEEIVGRVAVILQHQFGSSGVKAMGQPEALGFTGEGADHQQLLLAEGAGIAEEVRPQGIMLPVIAVFHHPQRFAQGDGLAVEVQNGIGVTLLLGHVDLGIVGVYIKPRFAGGEAGILTAVPLHRRPGGVPGGSPQPL